jgi:hypothetical protein
LKKSTIRQIVLSFLSPDSGDCVAMTALADSRTVSFCDVGVDKAWTLVDTNLPLYPVTSLLPFEGSKFLPIYNGNPEGTG